MCIIDFRNIVGTISDQANQSKIKTNKVKKKQVNIFFLEKPKQKT